MDKVVLVRVEVGGLAVGEGDEDLVGGVVVEAEVVNLIGQAVRRGDVVDHEGDVRRREGRQLVALRHRFVVGWEDGAQHFVVGGFVFGLRLGRVRVDAGLVAGLRSEGPRSVSCYFSSVMSPGARGGGGRHGGEGGRRAEVGRRRCAGSSGGIGAFWCDRRGRRRRGVGRCGARPAPFSLYERLALSSLVVHLGLVGLVELRVGGWR